MARNFFSNLFTGNDQPNDSWVSRGFMSPDTFGEDSSGDMASPTPRFRRPSLSLPGVSAYRDYLGQIPNREDYEPRGFKGALGTILAGVAGGMSGGGIGAYRTAADYRDSGYRDAVGDWKLKAESLKDNAELELDQAQRDWQNDKLSQDLGIKMMSEARLRQDSQNLAHYHDQLAANAASRNATYDRSVNDNIAYHSGMLKNSAFANTLRQSALGIQQGMLGVARQNANTNSRRGTDYGTYLRYKMTQGPNHVPSPRDQYTAQQMTMQNLANDPAWKDSFSVDDNGRITLSPNASPALRQMIQDRVNQSLAGQFRLYDEEENSPYSIEEDQ